MIHETVGPVPEPAPPAPDAAPPPVASAIDAARRRLLSLQAEDGHWCGELEGDTILESEYLLTLAFFGRLDERAGKAGRYLRDKQLPGGGWSLYPGGPAEVSASVKAYFCLKLLGDDARAPHMERAREVILALGGVEAANSFTKIYLSIFGQYDWWRCPAVPPEMVLLPRWSPFNLYEMSAWSRTIVVPLSILWACRPDREVPPAAGIGELFAAAAPRRPWRGDARPVWSAFFRGVNTALKLAERLRIRPLRRRALARAEAWILERLEGSDGLGAIFPPIVNSLLALACLGYPDDHPALCAQIAELERLTLEEGETLRLQPCFSPVWDTALAVTALSAAGADEDRPATLAAARWLIERQVSRPGDWRLKAPAAAPGGWCFEYANPFYPDCDDTGQVLIALSGVRFPDAAQEGRRRAAVERGQAWLLAMQNDDGGWASFDRGCDREVLTAVPFADHNAMIDPSTADVTGRVLECLSRQGLGLGHPAVDRAVAYLLRQQEADGTWYGRWGCNYVYGTWLALTGLRAALGPIAGEPWCARAAGWLLAHQNLDGGWGETPLSYDDPGAKGRGPSTAAQTSWALMALAAAGYGGEGAARRGVAWLLAHRGPDGSWHDEPWTGTGFPGVFYLRYHLYATYFPLLALAVLEESTSPCPVERPPRGRRRPGNGQAR